MGIYVDNDGFKEQKSKLDLVNRWDAIDAIMGEPTDAHYPAWYAKKLESLPSAEPKTWAEIVPKEESDMYIAGYRDGHDDATKTARWIKGDDYVCDYCGYHMVVGSGVYNYCPNCGARMLGEDGDEE